MPDSEEQLMLRVKAGDTDAFDKLFNAYRTKLFNYLLRFTGDTYLAEELFQETFLRLYRYAPKYQVKAKFSTFLFRIGTNLAINAMKKRRRNITFSRWRTYMGFTENVPAVEPEITSGERLPDEQLFAMQVEHHTQAALESLPEMMRVTLILSEIEGRKYNEIAQILGCSVGTVKSRVNRARAKLKRYLKEHEVL